tara:strand:+ start:117 stop:233 length:117 start_codon:yes stop_codon:yes gene_type:complete
MKNIFFVFIFFILLFSCGKKSLPEYEGIKIEKKINIST